MVLLHICRSTLIRDTNTIFKQLPHTKYTGALLHNRHYVLLKYSNVAINTWKYKMIVHIRPNTTGGRPSTKSDEFIFTNLICENIKSEVNYRFPQFANRVAEILTFLLCKNCSAVLALLKKCGLFRLRPLSTG